MLRLLPQRGREIEKRDSPDHHQILPQVKQLNESCYQKCDVYLYTNNDQLWFFGQVTKLEKSNSRVLDFLETYERNIWVMFNENLTNVWGDLKDLQFKG